MLSRAVTATPPMSTGSVASATARRARSAAPAQVASTAKRDELVAAEAEGAQAERGGQVLGGPDQRLVADLVAEGVVHRLEVVDVDVEGVDVAGAGEQHTIDLSTRASRLPRPVSSSVRARTRSSSAIDPSCCWRSVCSR